MAIGASQHVDVHDLGPARCELLPGGLGRGARLRDLAESIRRGARDPKITRMVIDPNEMRSIGLAALLVARTGDTNDASAAIAQLDSLHNPYLSGRHLLHAAGAR